MTRLTTLTLATLALLTGCPDNGITKFNAPPEAAILSHVDGDEVLEAYEVTFAGSASDPDNAANTLKTTWYSGDTVICEQALATADGLTSCTHTITPDDTTIRLEVIDPEASGASAKVDLVVTPTDSPEVVITTPEAGGVYYSDALITFSGVVTDTEDDNEDLTCFWESNRDGVLADVKAEPNADGEVEGFGYLTEGEHAVVLQCEDTTGKTSTDSVIITVGPPNEKPDCNITAPTDLSVSTSGDLVALKGEVADEELSKLTVEWSSDKDGVLGTSVANSDGTVSYNHSGLSVDTHVLSLKVTDTLGLECITSITHTVGTPPKLILISPSAGEVINDGALATFSATVTDDQDASPDIELNWDSSLDGVISTQRADSTGNVAFTDSTLTVGTHTLTVTATDPDGLYTTALVTFTVNGLPSAPVVSLGPVPADTNDDLNVSIDSASVDPEGDPITYSYAWTKNGVASAASTSASLPKTATAKGETWAVSVTPNDGYGDGDPGTASVVIANTPPVLSAVTLIPTTATVSDTLTCTPGTATDDDAADTVSFKYKWTVDSTVVTGVTSNTLSSASFKKNQSVFCTVTPTDGDDDGLPVDSNIVTIDNSIPSVSRLSITPDPAYAKDTLTCAWTTFTDADGDTDQSTVAWTKGSTAMGTGTSLTGGFVDGDVLTCTVTPYDGEDTGTSVSTTIEIDNTAPELASVTLTPASPVEGSTLTCTPGTATDDDGDTVTFDYAWTVAGTGISATTNTLTGADFDKGDSVTCTVTPKDGKTSGTAVVSNSVTIGNTKPLITSVTLSPTTAYTNTKLTATVTASDVDTADSLTYTYKWYSGTSVLAATGDTLDGTTWFDKNESISVEATANDGTDDSAPVTSTGVAILNTPPTAPVISIDPADPEAGTDDLVCVVDTDSTDADGDTITYSMDWTVDTVAYTGTPVTTDNTDDTIDGTETSDAEVWECTATPNDGDVDGATATASVTADGCKLGSASTCPAESCKKILDEGDSIGDGEYWLDPDGLGSVHVPSKFECDMTTDSGGWTKVAAWDRENDGETKADFESHMTKLVNGMTWFSDSASTYIEWYDDDLSSDVMGYERPLYIPNGGEALFDINYQAISMECSGVFFYAEDLKGDDHNLECMDDTTCTPSSAHLKGTNYTATELSYKPAYTCPAGSLNFTWNRKKQYSFGKELDKFHIRGFHWDEAGGDVSRLYMFELWVR